MNKNNLTFEDEVADLTVTEKEIQRSMARLKKARSSNDESESKKKGSKDAKQAENGKNVGSKRSTAARKLQRPVWSEPTSTLNTRIPPEMNRLLDDLVYQTKKINRKASKQQIVIQAIEETLAKQKLIASESAVAHGRDKQTVLGSS